MVGLLLGEVVSTKKTHILAKDVVGLLLGDNEDLTWTNRSLSSPTRINLEEPQVTQPNQD